MAMPTPVISGYRSAFAVLIEVVVATTFAFHNDPSFVVRNHMCRDQAKCKTLTIRVAG